jgi:glycosyltransferase involved in cell wall biosynthesis
LPHALSSAGRPGPPGPALSDTGTTRPLRVSLVHDFHGGEVPSGENEVVRAEVEALRRAGVAVHLAALHNDQLAHAKLHTVRGAVTTATGVGYSPLADIERHQPDVVHVHNLFPYWGSRWLRRVNAPIVATQHSYRPMCANGYLFRDGDVCTLCPDGRRWSGVRYGCYRDSALATFPLAVAARRGAAADPVLTAATRILVLSDRSWRVYEEAGLPASKLRRDWHFVPDDLVSPTTRESRAGWLFVGRLTAEKGIDRLVEEWPPESPLRVVGDGPLLSRLKSSATGKKIEFLGRLSRERVLDEMCTAFGLIVPSRWYETFGLVYIEALGAGLPVVAFPPNTVADALAADGTGLVASWGSLPAALDEAVRTFDQLRARCRQAYRDRYSEAAFVNRRTALYREVVASTHQR